MGSSLTVPWDDSLLAYDFGQGHPLAPVRVELTMALARSFGVFDAPGVSVVGVTPASDELLSLVHRSDYIEKVRNEVGPARPEWDPYGLGPGDTPLFPGMHAASALVVGASVGAAQAVWSGTSEHAVNVAGGLHHAMPSRASGFCVYNDPAIAIAWLLAEGAQRVAYVDVDVHHGDGVQSVFYDDPRVLTISLHEHPATLFPGTGLPEETGGPNAEGFAVNVALPEYADDEQWLRAFDAIVPPLLSSFAPEVLVTQHGCDTYYLDPLAHLALTIDGQRLIAERLHTLAHETASGRWVATGGGGYELVQAVPRAWTHLLAEAAGRPIPPQTEVPEPWRDLVRERTGRSAPTVMTDGHDPRPRPWAGGYDPANPVDRAILATRRNVFPWHGLDL